MAVKRGQRHTDMGIGASISCHCMVLGAVPGFICHSLQLGCLGHSWFLNTVVSSERERWKGSKGTYIVNVGLVSWGLFPFCLLISTYEVGPAGRRLGGWRMRARRGIVNGGGCEKSGWRAVVTWEYASLSGALNPIELVPMYVRLCIMLQHMSVSNSKNFLRFATLCQSWTSCVTILLSGSVLLLVYPLMKALQVQQRWYRFGGSLMGSTMATQVWCWLYGFNDDDKGLISAIPVQRWPHRLNDDYAGSTMMIRVWPWPYRFDDSYTGLTTTIRVQPWPVGNPNGHALETSTPSTMASTTQCQQSECHNPKPDRRTTRRQNQQRMRMRWDQCCWTLRGYWSWSISRQLCLGP